jgi:hypothetical protein
MLAPAKAVGGMEAGVSRRMRLFRESAMYTLPQGPVAIPTGWLN